MSSWTKGFALLAITGLAACTKLAWTTYYSTSEVNRGTAFSTAIDASGNVYLGGYEEQMTSSGGRTGTQMFLQKLSPAGNELYSVAETCVINMQANACWISGILPEGDSVYVTKVRQQGIGWFVASIARLDANSGATRWEIDLPRDVIKGEHARMSIMGNTLYVAHTDVRTTMLEGVVAAVTTDGDLKWVNGAGYSYGDKTLYPDARAGDWMVTPQVNAGVAEVVRHDGGIYGRLDRIETTGVGRIRGAGRLGNDVIVFGDANNNVKNLIVRRISPTATGLEVRESGIIENTATAGYVATAQANGALCYAYGDAGAGPITIGAIKPDLSHWSNVVNSESTDRWQIKLVDVQARGDECVYVYQDIKDTYKEFTTVIIRDGKSGQSTDKAKATTMIGNAAATTEKAIAVVGYPAVASPIYQAHKGKPLITTFTRYSPFAKK